VPFRLRRSACITAAFWTGLTVALSAAPAALAAPPLAGPPLADALPGPSDRPATDPTPRQQPPLPTSEQPADAVSPRGQASTAPHLPASERGEIKPIEGGQIIARVGSEIVLAADVLVGWGDFLAQNGDRIPESQRAQLRRMFMKRQLEQLVDTKLLYANARQTIPAEGFPKIEETLGKKFDEERVPQLMKLTKTSRRDELEAKLRSMGTSLAQRKQAFTETVLAQQWLRQEIQADSEITYDELWDYYQQHLTDFDVKARARWEEIVARFDRFPSKEDARKALEQWGNQVWYHPETFADVARKNSHGITADDGGRYDWTTQGSLRSDVVDRALSSLPLGKLSSILADEKSYRIVRVIERQAARRTSFTEAQIEIRKQINGQHRKTQVQSYIAHLRDTTPMWTAFDNDPDGSTLQ
jgi:hypothetical protein